MNHFDRKHVASITLSCTYAFRVFVYTAWHKISVRLLCIYVASSLKGLFHHAVYTLLCIIYTRINTHRLCADITLFCRNAIPQDRSKTCSARQAKKCGYKTKTVKILQSKKKSRFCHAFNGSAIQEITRILWNLTIHYRLVQQPANGTGQGQTDTI